MKHPGFLVPISYLLYCLKFPKTMHCVLFTYIPSPKTHMNTYNKVGSLQMLVNKLNQTVQHNNGLKCAQVRP